MRSGNTHSQSRSSPRCFWAWRSPPGCRWRFVHPRSPSSRTCSSTPSPACLHTQKTEVHTDLPPTWSPIVRFTLKTADLYWAVPIRSFCSCWFNRCASLRVTQSKQLIVFKYQRLIALSRLPGFYTCVSKVLPSGSPSISASKRRSMVW